MMRSRTRRMGRDRRTEALRLSALPVAGAGLLAGLLVFGPVAAATISAEATDPNAGSWPAARDPVQLDGNVYDLEYDVARDTIWFTLQQAGDQEPAWVYAYRLAEGKLDSYELPPADYNGFLSRVVITDDGAVWVSEPYCLIRLDPETRRISTLQLDLVVKDALPGAYDPNDPQPGTWISSLAPSGNGVEMARNRVPFLAHVSSTMQVDSTIRLPDAYAGSTELGVGAAGELYVGQGLLHGSRVAMVTADGKAITLPITASRLRERNGTVWGVGSSGDGAVVRGGAVQLPPGGLAADADPGSRSYPTPDNGLVRYNGVRNEIVRLASDGSVLRRVGLPSSASIAHGVRVTLRTQISDLVVDKEGNTWVFVQNLFQLQELVL